MADFRSGRDGQPGDPADAEPDDDARGDVSWSEWHTRGRHKLRESVAFSHEPMMRMDGAGIANEDDEDNDLLEADGDEEDHNHAEDDFCQHFSDGPGCPISDPGEPVADNEPTFVPVTLNPPMPENDQ